MQLNHDGYTFRFGEVLPATSEAAHFVVSIGAALNDLNYLHRLIAPPEHYGLLGEPPTPEESAFHGRMICSVTHEFRELMEAGNKSANVRQLLNSMPPEASAHQDTIDQLRRSTLRLIRNWTMHYKQPGDGDLQSALERVAGLETGIELGPSMVTIRAKFSDRVVMHRMGKTQEAINRLYEDLSKLTIASIHLCQYIIAAYFAEVPQDALEPHPANLRRNAPPRRQRRHPQEQRHWPSKLAPRPSTRLPKPSPATSTRRWVRSPAR